MSDNVEFKDGRGAFRTWRTKDSNSTQKMVNVGVELLVAISQTPTVSASPDYSTGDAIGGLLSFANATDVAAGYGTVISTVVICKESGQTPDIDLFLFGDSVSAPTDNAAYSPSDADIAKCVGVLQITSGDYSSLTNNTVGQTLQELPFKLESGTTLYGVMVARSTPNLASTSDITVRIIVRQN